MSGPGVRALEALEHIARGASSKHEVARLMLVSPHTVKNHLALASAYYGTRHGGMYTTLHTVLAAIKAGDLDLDDELTDESDAAA